MFNTVWADSGPFEAVIVRKEFPWRDGVPEIVPVDELIVNPDGNEPVTRNDVGGEVKPETDGVTGLIGVFTVPLMDM